MPQKLSGQIWLEIKAHGQPIFGLWAADLKTTRKTLFICQWWRLEAGEGGGGAGPLAVKEEQEEEARGSALENLAKMEALILQNVSSAKWQMADVTQAFYLSNFDQFGNVLLSGEPCHRICLRVLAPSKGGREPAWPFSCSSGAHAFQT